MIDKILTRESVHDLFMSCIRNEGKIVDMLMNKVYMDTSTNVEEIKTLVNELTEDFFPNGGGGASFMTMCTDRDGDLWTGEQRIMDELMTMAVDAKLMSFLFPKNTWSMLPGGMPYVVATFDRV
ncbi:MAG: hypothetical protein COA84_13885 [Robiginitomaculum sp.]|nr:MAG: hypothetical protein COA84_13885 [Robiginitomaculum sp.]